MVGIQSCQSCQDSFQKPNIHFLCPNDGLIHQDRVTFLCNRCKQSELIYKDGIYMCPECLIGSEPFQCRLCGSVEVTIFTERG